MSFKKAVLWSARTKLYRSITNTPYFYELFKFKSNEKLTLRVVVTKFQRCLRFASAWRFFRINETSDYL